MKIIFSLCFICLILTDQLHSQNASEYFPNNLGYKWYFKNTPLDSSNNPQPSLATYQIDSFAIIQNYKGLLANIVLSKTGLININQNAPYRDSNYYNFQTTNAWRYLKLFVLDTFSFDPEIINFLRSFEMWYSTFRFAQNVNTNYTIISRDTSISFDTLTLPLRVSSVGRRLNDQNVLTVNGNYLAKKFVITNSLFYLLTIPPFPTVAIPIIQQPDTIWIAQGVWVVKEIVPSVNVDLTFFGLPISFSVPGYIKELTSLPSNISYYSNYGVYKYKLYQNYPNPFNPITTINFDIPGPSHVKVAIYNSLGKMIETLLNQKLNTGSYKINFNGENYSNGVYYFKLEAENFSDVKKMILLK